MVFNLFIERFCEDTAHAQVLIRVIRKIREIREIANSKLNCKFVNTVFC
jgi:hypothetical protein